MLIVLGGTFRNTALSTIEGLILIIISRGFGVYYPGCFHPDSLE